MNNSLQDFVDSLNLPFEGDERNGKYVVILETSDDFSKVFNIIDLNDSLSVEGGSKATTNETKFKFTDGFYEVTLEANYAKDVYMVTIEEK